MLILLLACNRGETAAPQDAERPEYPTPVLGDEVCTDGLDNDADGLVDCEDADCMDNPACAEQDCLDETDNDLDGLVDCGDEDCWSESHCQSVLVNVRSIANTRTYIFDSEGRRDIWRHRASAPIDAYGDRSQWNSTFRSADGSMLLVSKAQSASGSVRRFSPNGASSACTFSVGEMTKRSHWFSFQQDSLAYSVASGFYGARYGGPSYISYWTSGTHSATSPMRLEQGCPFPLPELKSSLPLWTLVMSAPFEDPYNSNILSSVEWTSQYFTETSRSYAGVSIETNGTHQLSRRNKTVVHSWDWTDEDHTLVRNASWFKH